MNDGVTQTIPLSSVTGLPTDTGITLVIDSVDANGTATPQYEETITGIVSGTNIINCIRGQEGTAQAHNSGAVVEMLFTAQNWNDFVTGHLVGFNQNGVIKDGTTFRRGRRVVSVTQSATPAINTDITDVATITGLAQAITSMTTNLSGTPVAGDLLELQITDNGTASAITWGASFVSTTATLPTTTVISTLLRCFFEWDGAHWAFLGSV